MATSAAILAVGVLRVASAVVYRRYKKAADRPAVTKRWEHVYEAGAWGFSGLLGLLCWLTLMQTTNSALQMAVITTATGYAAAIAGRNAGRPFIAVGQLTFIMLPMVIALLIYPEWIHKVLGVVGLLFIFAMIDITLSIRDIIIQALTMTRKEAALAARFEEQAKRFDVALNNMSHGLCMLDQHDRLQVWNERFLELLHLQNVPVRVGMGIPELVRHSIRAGNHKGRSIKQVFRELSRSLQLNSFDQVQTAPDGERSIALSRRVMADGGSVIILEDVTERKRAQERISHLARYDELTGLANRSQFRERINDMLAELDDRDNCLTIHLIDLDRF
ncbi:MAG TPA: PAS-domain containing protein, partial [Pseudolabrys sp.]|nr:PAS-domain containing protein [Pseudolabrys sp.]